jgi:orotate phosphoribosyltransferase
LEGIDMEWGALLEKGEKYSEEGKTYEDMIDFLFDVSVYLENNLAAFRSSKRFAQGLIIQLLVDEFLKCCIEDDYVNFDHDHDQIKKSLLYLLNEIDWLNPEMENFLKTYRKIVNNALPTPCKFELTDDGSPIAEFSFKEPGQPDFFVSSRKFPLIAVLERSLANPLYAREIESRFLKKLKDIRESINITALCFVEKVYGPIGALGLLSSLVKGSELPALIYREGYWKRETRLTGYKPKPGDQICIIYDALVTGGAILNVSKFIEKIHKAKVVSAIVFFEYNKEIKAEESLKKKGIHLEVIGSYRKYESEIKTLESDTSEGTEHFTPIRNGRQSHPSVLGVDRPSISAEWKSEDGGIMESKTEKRPREKLPKWIMTLDAYEELVALKFVDIENFSKAGEILDKEEKGLPYDLVGDNTIIIPKEAIECFKGLKFAVTEVISAGDLPPEEIAALRATNLSRRSD